jgi:hypothetical protein
MNDDAQPDGYIVRVYPKPRGKHMNGAKLFEMYRECLVAEGVGMDDWEGIGEEDRKAWERLAARLWPDV